MIVPDLNLVVYAHVKTVPKHLEARLWWQELMKGSVPVGIASIVRLGFVRLLGNPALVDPVVPPEKAWAITRGWLLNPNVVEISSSANHDEILQQLLVESGVVSRHINDAYLAALCLERHAELHSNDKDFLRFPGLRLRDPLANRKSPEL